MISRREDIAFAVQTMQSMRRNAFAFAAGYARMPLISPLPGCPSGAASSPRTPPPRPPASAGALGGCNEYAACTRTYVSMAGRRGGQETSNTPMPDTSAALPSWPAA
eukprot:546162-Rhodomonas_salina.1